ncbi:MAG TPA: glutathione peroxidase [Chitinophagaceae bacterium]|nr:glutathione peroxidase [Chitinophagaceae bacterium]HNF30501.1 glutathione peroxidase [Chitinophagaceae bacterium]HNM33958.1 glutathione peroxidase [Chitinophagaceae bacterium]
MRAKHYLILLVLILTAASFTIYKQKKIYSFKVDGIEGGKINFAKFKGKKILIVNTASECQYTYQYAELQSLYTTYQDKLVIVGFPCNQFGHQEMGSNDDINSFCKVRYGVSFPLASKVDVKGENAAPIYKWLCNKSENGVMDVTIKWNFNKFLIDEKGRLLAHFPSNVKADSDEILKYLK